MSSLDIDKLIEEVEKRPSLYNTQIPEYSDRILKMNLWEEVCKALYPEWDKFELLQKGEKGMKLQKRWKSLKDCFRREVLIQNKNSESGRTFKRRKYIYFDQLQFLMPSLNQRMTAPSMSLSEVKHENSGKETDEENPDENCLEKEKDFQPTGFQQKKITTDHKKKEKELIQFDRESIISLKKKFLPDEKNEDDDRHFLMSLLPTLKRFDEEEKMWVRIEIMRVIKKIQEEIRKRKKENYLQNYFHQSQQHTLQQYLLPQSLVPMQQNVQPQQTHPVLPQSVTRSSALSPSGIESSSDNSSDLLDFSET